MSCHVISQVSFPVADRHVKWTSELQGSILLKIQAAVPIPPAIRMAWEVEGSGVKLPSTPLQLTFWPSFRWSCSQLDTSPSRLTVTEKVPDCMVSNGWEEIVQVLLVSFSSKP